MNRHRENLALIMDAADSRRDSHVRARETGVGADLQNVIVRPTILVQERRYERRVEAAAEALALQAAKLHALLAEPLTRPLGSMQTPKCFTADDATTLVQNKSLGTPSELPHSQHARTSARAAEPLPHVAPHAPLRDATKQVDAPTTVDDAPRRVDDASALGLSDGRASRTASPHRRSQAGQVREDRSPRDGTSAAPANTPEVEVGSYNGLRDIREYAHARLESIEKAAANRQTAVVRPPNAQRARAHRGETADPHQATATVNAGPQVFAPRPKSERRLRSEGLTDARNALRRAYAASKRRAPNAPPRSSAREAGVVDGWYDLPKSKRSRAHPRNAPAIWPWATALALSSMFLAYSVTLTVVHSGELAQQPQPVTAVAMHTASPPPPQLSEPAPIPKPEATTRPRTSSGAKPPRSTTRNITRTECRDQPVRD